MGNIRKVLPVKLFVGILTSSTIVLEKALAELTKHYGDIDQETELWEFSYTDYYQKEMGTNIQRKFVSFEKVIDPEKLKEIKVHTNEIERELASIYAPPVRPINLDPGYLSLSKVILATTKDYSHRMYLGSGIFAEVTLRYHKNQFSCWEWTYPDYKTEQYLKFFQTIRDIYKQQLPS